MRSMLFALLLAAVAAPAAAQHAEHAREGDQAAVLATVERLFGALASKDRAALLGAVVAEGRATSTGVDEQGRPEVHSSDWTTFADRLAGMTDRLRERLIDPHVHVEGDIAMIWSRYEFERDGVFSHCGIDHFDLVRIEGRWRVLNLTWTRQTEGCPGR
jgi:putative lumazine-binding protein